jgi:hypothetical protein
MLELPMNLLAASGPWLYPLLAVAACLAITVVRAAVVIRALDDAPPPAGPPHTAVVAWGVLGGVVGLLGTLVGFGRLAVGARVAAGAERPELEEMLAVMWEGVLVIVTPFMLGLWLFTASIVAWLVLQLMLGRRLR